MMTFREILSSKSTRPRSFVTTRQQSFLMRSNVEKMTPTSQTIFLQFLLHRTLSIARGLSETRTVSESTVQVRTPGYCVSLSSPSFNPLPTLTGFLFIRAWLQCVRCGCTEHGSPAFILTQSC